MKTQTSNRAHERGLAVVVVLALLLLMVAFMAGNSVTLRSLHQELQIIEKQQLRRYAPRPAPPQAAQLPDRASASGAGDAGGSPP